MNRNERLHKEAVSLWRALSADPPPRGLRGARLLDAALHQFFEIREVPGLKKKPSTSELLDWLKLILAEDLSPEDLKKAPGEMLPKLHGALLKNEQDVALFEKLAFMARRKG